MYCCIDSSTLPVIYSHVLLRWREDMSECWMDFKKQLSDKTALLPVPSTDTPKPLAHNVNVVKHTPVKARSKSSARRLNGQRQTKTRQRKSPTEKKAIMREVLLQAQMTRSPSQRRRQRRSFRKP